MNRSRQAPGHPAPDLARSLGTLLVMGARLQRTFAAVEQYATAFEGTPPWVDASRRLLSLASSVEQAAAEKIFTGSSGEHLVIQGEGGINIAADAGYISTLAHRMERQERVGRLLVPDFATMPREPVALAV